MKVKKDKQPTRMLKLSYVISHIRELNSELSQWLAEAFINDGLIEIPPAFSHIEILGELYLHPDVLDWLYKTKGLVV